MLKTKEEPIKEEGKHIVVLLSIYVVYTNVIIDAQEQEPTSSSSPPPS